MRDHCRNAFLILVTIIACSCNKTPLDHPEYIGSWYGVTVAGEQDVNIHSDGTGNFGFYNGGPVGGSGKVTISKSHVRIGNSNFDILVPPTQIDPAYESGQLVSWKMSLRYTEIFTSGEVMNVYRK